MSLNNNDLTAIRAILREELEPLENKTSALENDVKEIYYMISSLETKMNAKAT